MVSKPKAKEFVKNRIRTCASEDTALTAEVAGPPVNHSGILTFMTHHLMVRRAGCSMLRKVLIVPIIALYPPSLA